MVNYSVKSWDSFCFCVTPKELCRVLEGLHFVRYSGIVAENYRETPVGEYAARYEKLLEYLKTDCREQFRVVSLDCFDLLRELPNGEYADVQAYREAVRWEPRAMVGPFSLKCWPVAGRTTLSTAFNCWDDSANVVGLKISCPKTILYCQGDGYSEPVSTAEMDCWKEYQMLKKRVQAITKPLKVEVESREVRTKIRVSPAMKERLAAFYFFRNNSVKIVG